MFHTLMASPAAGASSSEALALTISNDQRNLRLWDWVVGQEPDASNYSTFTITIASGVKIGSDLTSIYAFRTDGASTDFPSGATLTITNNGAIVGKGGDGGIEGTNGSAGGNAMYFTLNATLVNNNRIGGGGGGGGGSDDNGTSPSYGGGGGAGYMVGLGGDVGIGPSGLNGTLTSGGVGLGTAGNGGALGAAGSNSTDGQSGGAAGDAIHKNGKTVTVTNNGTISGTVSATT